MKLFSDRLRWALIFYAFLVSAMSYLDRVNLSIAGPTLQKEFGLTDVQLGYVFSAFVWSYALFQAPSGRLADRFGPRWVLTFGILWWSACTRLGPRLQGRCSELLQLRHCRAVHGMGRPRRGGYTL